DEGASVSSIRILDCVIPAWSGGIQIDMDVSGGILASLDAGYPCRHDGDPIFISVDEAQAHASLHG
ncbi:MAG TPA: hypothetical protein VHJ56_06100, partial [Candidatus Binatia bacterium]|nr:hypothetical protein [Candidatus Binatia bacterium]